MEYRDLKTDPMQDAVKELLEKAKKAPVTDKDDDGEGMDPVGHGDKDIDNDGDHDSTDKYLTKRRKAITKAVKKEDSCNSKNENQKTKDFVKKKTAMPEANEPSKENGGIAHDCATHVAHEEYGLGTCVSEEHTLAEDGTVSHYDVIFERVGLKRDVPVNELKITASEKHLHASKKKSKNLGESIGDDLFKSGYGSKDFRKELDLDKHLRGGPMNGFHTVGKPIVVQVEDEVGDAEDIIFYSDGKYILQQVGHKEVGDYNNVPDEEGTEMYLEDPRGNLSPAKFKAMVNKYAKYFPKDYGMKIKKITNSVRDFKKVGGQDHAPRGIRREPFKK